MPTSRNFDLSQSITSRDENVDDRVAALLVGGANITVTYDDAAGTLTVDGQSGYTDADVANLIVGGNNITATYNSVAGTLTLDGQPGYTDTDVGNYLSTNGYATQTAIVAAITDSAPTTLDTLNELAAALGDDPNFATTVTNSIADKLPLAGGTLTGALTGTDATFTGTVTAGTMTDGTVSFNAGDITGVDTLRINQTGTGLRMTNIGAFDSDGSSNFRIFSNNDLVLSTNGDSGTVVTFDATTKAATFTGVITGDGSGITNLSSTVQGTVISAGSLRGTVNNATVQYGTAYSGTPAQGSFFFDSLNQKLKVYTGSAFVDAVPAGSGGGGGGGASGANATFRKYTYSITSSTNSVSGADDASETLSYVTTGEQNVEVYVNGVKQVEGATNDYVATTGTSVTFVDNLSSGDVVDVQVYELLTNDAYYLKTETYTQTETNTQISTALNGAISPSSATINDLLINRITGANDYTQIKKTNTGSNLAITSPESLYLNIDSNNDQTNRSVFIVANTEQPGSGNLIAKFQEDGNVGIGTQSPQTTLDTGYTRVYSSGAATSPASGKGLEVHYVTSGRTQGEGAYLIPYDRDNSAYKQFTIDANNIVNICMHVLGVRLSPDKQVFPSSG